MNKTQKSLKKKLLQRKLDKFFEETDFDVSGIPSSSIIFNEAYLAKLITKIAVGAATVYWSSLELREFSKLRKDISRKVYSNDF
jgi:hypothetical protein